MTTILIRPNCSDGYAKALTSLRACEPPLWLCMMANCYNDPIIIDADIENLNIENVYERIENYKVDKIVILASGNHPSANVQQKDIAESWHSFFTNCGYNTEIYDYLPFDPTQEGMQPRWDLIDLKKYKCHNWHGWNQPTQNYGCIFTTISCPYSCSFCQVKNFYRSIYKKRNMKDVIKDLYFQYNLGIRNFKMMDELFVIPNHHTLDFCDEVSKTIGKDINIWAYARIDTVNEYLLKRLRESGIRWLAFGIESGNYDIRKTINKGNFTNSDIINIIKMTKHCGINIVGNYMFGFWEDNMNTMKETLDLALDLNCEYNNFYCVTVYPNSELYKQMKDQCMDLPIKSTEYAQMSPYFKPIDTKHLKGQEVLKFRDHAFNLIHSNNDYISMIKTKFGENVVNEINNMLKIKIERKNIWKF